MKQQQQQQQERIKQQQEEEEERLQQKHQQQQQERMKQQQQLEERLKQRRQQQEQRLQECSFVTSNSHKHKCQTTNDKESSVTLINLISPGQSSNIRTKTTPMVTKTTTKQAFKVKPQKQAIDNNKRQDKNTNNDERQVQTKKRKKVRKEKTISFEELYYGLHVFYVETLDEMEICGFNKADSEICLRPLANNDDTNTLESSPDKDETDEECSDDEENDVWVSLSDIQIIPTAFNKIPSNTEQLSLGQEIMAKCYRVRNDWFYKGIVSRVFSNNRIAVHFDDGDSSRSVALNDVRTRGTY
eukprot:TRINITY_DN122_c1_g1_i3.p1 TRINITY_DN122_c1_g1~~TRINITY_DN122_c1_g1_i3.p1  ORF type:complete len:300 (+),score=95.32 TRINITY_DN122_c1_g1_i3:73-972(+)